MTILQTRIVIKPRAFEASVEFYEKGLGLCRAREWGRPPARGVVYFIGGGFLELVDSVAPEPVSGCSLWLQVPDLKTIAVHLEALGKAIDEAPELKPWGLRQMALRDPDGLRIILVEVPPEHPLRRDVRLLELAQ